MTRPNILFFDVNETLLDLSPLNASVAAVLGGKPELATLWFRTTLQHSRSMTLAGRYDHFDEIGVACLRMIAVSEGTELTPSAANLAMAPMRSLPPHSDATGELGRLRRAGFRLTVLTNSSRSALDEQMKHSGLAGYFDLTLSVEEIGLFKPHTHVYRWAARRAGEDVADCLLVAAHGWDVAGAGWSGMKTAFIARPSHARFPLGPEIELLLPSLDGLAGALTSLTGR